MAYRIEIKPRARRQSKHLPAAAAAAIDAAIGRFAVEPRPAGCKRVQGLPDGLRVRVGDYRIIYVVDDHIRVVHVLRIAWRDKAYKRRRDLRGE